MTETIEQRAARMGWVPLGNGGYGSPVFKNILDHIGDAFRKERDEHQNILLNGHRVKALVEGKRYSFTEACKLMNVNAAQIMEALEWLLDDNVRLNVTYGAECHTLGPNNFVMAGWMKDQEAAKVVSLAGRR